MEIKGNIHCLFEQSGTFKNAFKGYGYNAYDYDIQDNFSQTDYRIDLFAEIENAYGGGGESIFDKMTEDDLIMAFFPCIYFSTLSQINFLVNDCLNYRTLTVKERYDKVVERIRNRAYFYEKLYKLVGVAQMRGLRIILENPASQPHYLLFPTNFIKPPTFIDKNRALRGDYFKKPTAYWFFQCEPTCGESYNENKHPKIVKRVKCSGKAGICSEERSMISPEYAKNFIADFVIGKEISNTQKTLF